MYQDVPGLVLWLVEAPHNFNTSLLLHLKNFPAGHWFLVASFIFRNFRPGTAGPYLVQYLFICMCEHVCGSMNGCALWYTPRGWSDRHKQPLNSSIQRSRFEDRLKLSLRSRLWLQYSPTDRILRTVGTCHTLSCVQICWNAHERIRKTSFYDWLLGNILHEDPFK